MYIDLLVVVLAIIGKNVPKCGDSQNFLREIAKQYAKKFNPPLANSKFVTSRALDKRMNDISALDYRDI